MLTTGRIPVRAALVNPAVRIRSVVELVAPQMTGAGQPYPWTAESRRTADELDFVARAGAITAQPRCCSSAASWTIRPTDGRDRLVDALRRRYAQPDEVELISVPDLAHPLADEPGMEPAPQLPTTKVVDQILTQWFLRRLTAK